MCTRSLDLYLVCITQAPLPPQGARIHLSYNKCVCYTSPKQLQDQYDPYIGHISNSSMSWGLWQSAKNVIKLLTHQNNLLWGPTFQDWKYPVTANVVETCYSLPKQYHQEKDEAARNWLSCKPSSTPCVYSSSSSNTCTTQSTGVCMSLLRLKAFQHQQIISAQQEAPDKLILLALLLSCLA